MLRPAFNHAGSEYVTLPRLVAEISILSDCSHLSESPIAAMLKADSGDANDQGKDEKGNG